MAWGRGKATSSIAPKSSVEWILLPVLDDRETKVCKVKAPKTAQMMGDRARMQLRPFKFIGSYFVYYSLRLQGQRSLEEVVWGCSPSWRRSFSGGYRRSCIPGRGDVHRGRSSGGKARPDCQSPARASGWVRKGPEHDLWRIAIILKVTGSLRRR